MSFNANIFLRNFSPIMSKTDYGADWSNFTYFRHSKSSSHAGSRPEVLRRKARVTLFLPRGFRHLLEPLQKPVIVEARSPTAKPDQSPVRFPWSPIHGICGR